MTAVDLHWNRFIVLRFILLFYSLGQIVPFRFWWIPHIILLNYELNLRSNQIYTGFRENICDFSTFLDAKVYLHLTDSFFLLRVNYTKYLHYFLPLPPNLCKLKPKLTAYQLSPITQLFLVIIIAFLGIFRWSFFYLFCTPCV